MKITKKQLRKMLNEVRMATGQKRAFSPMKSRASSEFAKAIKFIQEDITLASDVETVEDAWSGGENLEQPIDRAEEYMEEDLLEACGGEMPEMPDMSDASDDLAVHMEPTAISVKMPCPISTAEKLRMSGASPSEIMNWISELTRNINM
jgi:hypothetical protein